MKNKFLVCILLFGIAFIFYGNSISNKFALDDFIVITGNKFTQKGFAGLKDIFTHDSFVGAYDGPLKLSGGRYRPLSIASFAIEKSVFGYKVEVFHFFNVLFFALTVVIMFLFLSRLFSYHPISGNQVNHNLPFISALFFAILPIHTEVVANIKSRDEIFALLFSIITFFLLLSKQENKKQTKADKLTKANASLDKSSLNIPRIAAGAIIFFLALLSKENAITFLVLIPLGLILFSNDSKCTIALKTIPLAVVAIVYLSMRANFAGVVGDRETTDIMDNPYMNATFFQKFATISIVQLKYLVLMIIPYKLSYDYSYNQIPIVGLSNPLSLLSIVIHLALLIYAIRMFSKNKIVSYFIIFYFITFFIVSNLMFNIGTSMAERFTYMPSFGLCIILAFGFIRLFKINLTGNPTLKTAPILVLLVLVFLAAIKTIARNKEWLDNMSLFKADINKVPGSARSHLYYGIECYNLYEKNRIVANVDEAVLHLKKSAEINPKFHYAWLNLGVVYEHTDRYREALNSYKNVLKLEPENLQAMYGMGYAYGRGLNQPDSAITYFKKLIDEFKSTKAEYYEGLGNCYSAKENMTEAINYYKQGISLNPNVARLYFNAGISYGKIGKLDSSDIYFNRAFELDPSLKQK